MSRCPVHGSYQQIDANCDTVKVLCDVGAERERQFKLHGANLHNLSGTGPDAQWAAGLAGFTGAGASRLESALRAHYEATEEKGEHVTWLQILLEEFSEVAKTDDHVELYTELIQVAAVAVSWAEKLVDPESVIGPAVARSGGPTD